MEIKLPNRIYKKIALIRSSIISRIGGAISFDDVEESKIIVFKWKKRDPVKNEMLGFKYAITYLDLNDIKDPIVYGQLIGEKIENSLKEGQDVKLA